MKNIDTCPAYPLRGAPHHPLAMQKKSTSRSAFFNLRALIGLLLCAATAYFILIPIRSGLAFPRTRLRTLRKERSRSKNACRINELSKTCTGVIASGQRERPDPKPSLDAVMSQAQLEKKVEDYLRNSQALEDYWQRPITLSSCKLRWIAWHSTPDSQKCCRNSLKRSGTIPLSSRSVWPDPRSRSVCSQTPFANQLKQISQTSNQIEAHLRANYSLPNQYRIRLADVLTILDSYEHSRCALCKNPSQSSLDR